MAGKLSYKLATEEAKQASLGIWANNNPSESNFAILNDALSCMGNGGLERAAAEGQTRYNNDMGRGLESMVTGRGSKKEVESRGIGLFHQLQTELQNSLVACGKRHADKSNRDFAAALKRQRDKREEKKKIVTKKKLDKAKKQLTEASWLHQQYDSPRCWSTVEIALREFGKLKSKTAKLRNVKEQILI